MRILRLLDGCAGASVLSITRNAFRDLDISKFFLRDLAVPLQGSLVKKLVLTVCALSSIVNTRNHLAE